MKRLSLVISLMLIVSILAACSPAPTATPTPLVVTKEVTKVVEVSKVVTATPVPPQLPAVGGTLVYALPAEPESLDPQRSTSGSAYWVLDKIGSALIARDPKTGNFVPYLAESWSVEPDGMSWRFNLRKDIKFHDGTPCTAKDYAYTFQRALDPKNLSTVTASALTGVKSVEALDDYTLRVNYQLPVAYTLSSLSQVAYFQPVSKAAVDKYGAEIGRNPVGVGPYKFKEWKTGTSITLVRNPDFKWAPKYATNTGAPLIETIEFRIIPEDATRLAGLEAGQVDFASYINPKDLARIDGTKNFQRFDTGTLGISPGLYFNVTKGALADQKVRQAITKAIDRDSLIKVVALGQALPQYGPVSPDTPGYWPGVEYVGFKYDVAGAKALLKDAGYTAGADGMLTGKDGKALKFELQVASGSADRVKIAEIIQQQLKAVGIATDIKQQEQAIADSNLLKGNFEIAISGNGWADTGLMFAMFHSSMVGALNATQIKDPELDKLIGGMGFTTNVAQNVEMGNQVQKYIVEKAYIVGLYAPRNFAFISNKVKGVVFANLNGAPVPQFFDAYMVTK